MTLDDSVEHLRGEEKLTKFHQDKTIATGNTMDSYFCSVCGSLMYRVSSGFPGMRVLRIGTVDDFHLHETKLKPQFEQFVESRVAWCNGCEGAEQEQGDYFAKG